MALLRLQYSHQAETLLQLHPFNSLVWFRMLALNGEGFIKTLHISHQEPSAYPMHLLAFVISNKDLFERSGTEQMATILMRRHWRWIGHVTRQEASIAKTALKGMPEGKHKRGLPKITWRRTMEKEIKVKGKTWGDMKLTRDRLMWREHGAALHAT